MRFLIQLNLLTNFFSRYRFFHYITDNILSSSWQHVNNCVLLRRKCVFTWYSGSLEISLIVKVHCDVHHNTAFTKRVKSLRLTIRVKSLRLIKQSNHFDWLKALYLITMLPHQPEFIYFTSQVWLTYWTAAVNLVNLNNKK